MLRKPYFTQSIATKQRNSKQYFLLLPDFSEIFSYFSIFREKNWEFWERDSFPFHFQKHKFQLIVNISLNTSWEQWEHRKILFIVKSRSNHAKTVKFFLNPVISA
ncbi:hypothetical protein PRO82_001054 [Candidatus Protochlamydia amoebophila]|nr:hypothetical protein [Candidatus Protochlamydia amoebophila]